MTIRFLCPNGHQLSAPESMAGKAGKCPKCNTAFAIPTLEELNAEAPAEEPAPAPAAATTSETSHADGPSAEATPPKGSSPTLGTPAPSSGTLDLGSTKGLVGMGSGTGSGSCFARVETLQR